jgi:hypothetical protein
MIMFVTRILATAGTLTMAAALLGGLASSAQASTGPPCIYGVITGPHSITLAVGSAALPGEVIRPETPGYGPNVTVTSVSGQVVTTGGTFLPLNTKGAKTAFATISGAPAPV